MIKFYSVMGSRPYSVIHLPNNEEVIVKVGEFVSKEAAITHIQCSWPERVSSVILSQSELDQISQFIQG